MNSTDNIKSDQMKPGGRFPSVFLPILETRLWPAIILGISLLQAVLTMVGLPSWACPIFKATGYKCPGCGMSRAIASLFKADWVASWQFHPFAPVYATGAILLIVLICLPDQPRKQLVTAFRYIDNRYGLSVIILGSQILWGLWRLVTELTANG